MSIGGVVPSSCLLKLNQSSSKSGGVVPLNVTEISWLNIKANLLIYVILLGNVMVDNWLSENALSSIHVVPFGIVTVVS